MAQPRQSDRDPPFRSLSRSVHGTLVGVTDLMLRTFQSLDCVRQLQNDAILKADWEHVVPGTEHAYARMVEAMSEYGIDTEGRPPMWAWRGVLRRASTRAPTGCAGPGRGTR